MQRTLNFREVCWYVCQQVPEADPGEVRRYVMAHISYPCDLSSVYQFARNIESRLICEGGI